jgi:antitoxin VapB
MTQLARVFRSGNSQAVRLPKGFRFAVDEVEVSREGDAVILRPHIQTEPAWSSLRAALIRGVSDDFMTDGRRQPTATSRPNLEDFFE